MKKILFFLLYLIVILGASAQSLRRYEYWIDSDYSKHITVQSSNTNISLSISTEGQAVGVHVLNFRAQNSNGEWCPVNRMLYYIPETAEQTGTIKEAEYWMDDDFSTHRIEKVTMSGNAVYLSITISHLTEGTHTLNIRVRDSNGEWSSISRLLFYVPVFPELVIATIDTNEPFIKVARREGWIGSSDTQMTQSQAEAVSTIGTAFRGNTEIVTLNELEYFSSVTKIDAHAFNGCQKMTAIRIPDTITEIGDSAFYYCKALAEFYMPSSVQKVGRWGFAYCTGLKKVTISDLAAWSAIAFTGNLSTPLHYAKHLYLNGEEVIDLVVPDGVTTINSYAFWGGSSIKTVSIPATVKSIKIYSFARCSSLKSIIIPSTVTSISTNPFIGCSGLTSIVIEGDNKYYDSRNNCNAIIRKSDNLLITGCQTTKIPSAVTTLNTNAFNGQTAFTTFDIPSSITKIGINAFENCSNLTSVSIPAHVTTIGTGVFLYCTKLMKVTCHIKEPFAIDSSVFTDNTKNGGTLYVPAGTKAKYEATAGWKEFKNIVEADLSQLNVIATIDTNEPFIKVARREGWIGSSDTQMTQSQAEAVTTIGTAFRGNTEIITLNELEYFINVTKIDVNAFNGCQKMTAIRIPDTITEIGDSAFMNCKALAEFYMPSSVVYTGKAAFQGCSGMKKVIISDLVAWCKIKHYAGYSNPLFFATHLYLKDKEITDLVIPSNVTSIANYAFYGCCYFKTITIHNAVTTIGSWAFGYGTRLTTVFIPSSVTTIGTNPFVACRNLTSIVVESGNKFYDSRDGCNAIIRTSSNGLVSGCKTTKIPANVLSINNSAFNSIGMTEADIPSMVKTIGNSAFSYSNITTIAIPASVTTIGTYAFSGCTKLMKVTCLIKEPFAIDSSVFTDNTKNEGTLYVPAGTKTKYETTAGWKEFKDIVEMELVSTSTGESDYNNGDEINENTNLNGNVIGNILYSIDPTDGGYNKSEGCIEVTKPTSDDDMDAIAGKDPFGEDVRSNFTGIIFMVSAGKGTIKVNAETTGGMLLKVKIGNDEPTEMELDGKLKATFHYNVTKPTYVYIYASYSGAASARGNGEEPSLKIYGIEWKQDAGTPTDIDSLTTNPSPKDEGSVYTLGGQRIDALPKKKGVYIRGGKKFVR